MMSKDEPDRMSLRRLNLNMLYTLDAILNTSSLTEAAQLTHVSQPAISVALKKLKGQLNDDLIIYLNGKRVLTPLAQGLRSRVRKLLIEVDETLNFQVTFDPQTSRKTFRLAASESLATMLLGRVVPKMLSEARDISVVVSTLNRTTHADLFETGVDLIISPEALVDHKFPSTELIKDRLSCMVWDEHPSIKSTISMEQYLDARHAAVSETSNFNVVPQEIFSKMRVSATTGRYGTLAELIIGTDLIATGSSWVLQYYASRFPVKVLKLPFATMETPIYVQWPSHLTNDPAHMWLMRYLNDFAEPHRIAHATFMKK